MKWLTVALAAVVWLASCATCQAQLAATWTLETRPYQGTWTAEAEPVVPDEEGVVTFKREKGSHMRLCADVDRDLSRTPCLEILAHASSMPWRLTGQVAEGPEIVLADQQLMGRCRRNVARRLRAAGPVRLAMRFYAVGWGRSPLHELRFTPSLLADCEERDASDLGGSMAVEDASTMRAAEDIRSLVPGHPRLRFNASNREAWQERAAQYPGYAKPISDVIADLEAAKAEPPLEFPAYSKERPPTWGAHLLSLRPPAPPELAPGEGRDAITFTRDLYWHQFSSWVIGAAICDDPVFVEQARRWAVTWTDWRFWLDPDFQYFDFYSGYPLQCLATAYDVASHAMTEGEQERVRQAIAAVAHGLYLNTISGHGSIYNDLRGNHTAVTMCALGLAGLALMDEHPDAARWVALAEKFMVDAFNEHTSGGWLESPGYGQYGVSEWLRLADAIRNVTGHDHFRHPFLQRYAEGALYLADWEGRDLGYNQGGAGAYWNQWLFFAIARELQDPRLQWLANPLSGGAPEFHAGYGDVFWWVDPQLEQQRPTETDTGRHFADIGVSVWRSGWDDKATILLHQCGAKGQHKEQNMNHVTLYALGERLLPDGLGARTSDHNVAMVDDQIQNLWAAGRTLAYHSDRRSGYALGDYGVYYGWKRQVLFLRPDLVVLVDDLELRNDRDCTLQFLLHPNGEVSVEGKVLTVTRGQAALQACTVLPDGSLLPLTVESLGEGRRATHQSAASYLGRGQLRAVTFLLISPADRLAPVSVEAARDGLQLVAGERRYLLGLAPGEIAPGFSSEANLWVARLGADGPERILMCEAQDMWRSAGTRMRRESGWGLSGPEPGHSDARLITPAGSVAGGPCVSWDAHRQAE